MKLNKRVKRTFPEGNGTPAIILEAVS